MRFRVASLCHCQIPAAVLSPPDIIETTHISPLQCVKQRAVVRFPSTCFRTYIFHSPSLVISPTSKFTFRVVAANVYHVFLLFSFSEPHRRLDDCTLLPVKFSIEYGSPLRPSFLRSRYESIRECRRHNDSQSVVANIGRAFSIYFDTLSLPFSRSLLSLTDVLTLISEPIRKVVKQEFKVTRRIFSTKRKK